MKLAHIQADKWHLFSKSMLESSPLIISAHHLNFLQLLSWKSPKKLSTLMMEANASSLSTLVLIEHASHSHRAPILASLVSQHWTSTSPFQGIESTCNSHHYSSHRTRHICQTRIMIKIYSPIKTSLSRSQIFISTHTSGKLRCFWNVLNCPETWNIRAFK